MAWTIATYSTDDSTVTLNDNTFAHNKWWESQEWITDNLGVWCDVHEVYIPHGLVSEKYSWYWPTEINFVTGKAHGSN